MPSDWKARLGMVYSTDPDFNYDTGDTPEADTPPPARQELRVWLDRRQRAGKAVTVGVRGRYAANHTGVRLDAVLGTRVFNASFEANLSHSGAPAQRAFQDLIELRQFLTGNGTIAFFDLPWMPIYLAVLFFLHPFLGWVALAFTVVQMALAWFGHRRTVAPAEKASKASQEVNQFLHAKLRNTEVVESMGMLAGLQQRWAARHAQAMDEQGRGLEQRGDVRAASDEDEPPPTSVDYADPVDVEPSVRAAPPAGR